MGMSWLVGSFEPDVVIIWYMRFDNIFYIFMSLHMIDFMTILALSLTIRFTPSYGLRGKGCRGCDCMVVGFTTTYAISVVHHESCEFESRSWRDVLDATLCDKVCQWLAAGRWFSLGTPVSSINKTDHHDNSCNIAESGFKHHKHNSPNLWSTEIGIWFEALASQYEINGLERKGGKELRRWPALKNLTT